MIHPLFSLFLFFFLLLLTSSAGTEKLIFILAGQSNMSGRGGVFHDKWDQKVPPQSHPSPSILRLNANRTWELAVEPLHVDIDVGKTCGVGPGLPFANAVRNFWGGDDVVLGLVPCAIGGTKIAQWARGRTLYENMVGRAKAAVGGGGTIGAVLWYQGESDTESASDAKAYRGRIKRLVADVRADLGDPKLLFIQV